MRACQIDIKNFRGISNATIFLPKHGVLIGDNNTGKTTILEALDLVLGPDRLNRNPIDEHDFFRGKYRVEPTSVLLNNEFNSTNEIKDKLTETPRIEIDVTITDLTEEQKARFGDYIEFWDSITNSLYVQPDTRGIDSTNITEALRITFHGRYDEEEDDFEGKTFFTRSLNENHITQTFTRKDKEVCGFLYLRSVRTGSRALSLEKGSLLDIILRLKEIRPQMWEDTLKILSKTDVASNPDLGISPVLESINKSLKKYVPSEWGIEPHLRVSNLTREHLRKVITAFITTVNQHPKLTPCQRRKLTPSVIVTM